jgi:GNAT superfamily N-acetyltransferase
MASDRSFLDSLTTCAIGTDLNLSPWKCGEGVDWFLKHKSCEYHAKRISTVTCWLHEGDLAGYISTSMSHIELYTATEKGKLGLEGVRFHEQQRKAAKFFPAFLIGMLGTTELYQRRGLGDEMVKYAIGQARATSLDVACRFVVVDSEKTDKARGLYKKNNFCPVEGQSADRETEWMYFDLGPR